MQGSDNHKVKGRKSAPRRIKILSLCRKEEHDLSIFSFSWYTPAVVVVVVVGIVDTAVVADTEAVIVIAVVA
jgi:hypothetical protein